MVEDMISVCNVCQSGLRYEITYLDTCLDTKEQDLNTPGTAGGPGGRDRTLAVKSKKIARKSPFFLGNFYFFTKIN